MHENEYENRTGKNLSSFPENRIKIEDPDTKEQLYNYRCNIVQGEKTTLDPKWVLFKENENIYVMFITNIWCRETLNKHTEGL